MKKKWKRVIALVLCVCMFVGMNGFAEVKAQGEVTIEVTPTLEVTPSTEPTVTTGAIQEVSPTQEGNEEPTSSPTENPSVTECVSVTPVEEDTDDITPTLDPEVTLEPVPTPDITDGIHEETVTVSFLTMDADEVYTVTEEMEIAFGATIEVFPDTNTPDGFTFLYWDDEYHNVISADTMFTQDTYVWAEYAMAPTYEEELTEEERAMRSYSSISTMTEDEVYELFYTGESPKEILGYLQGVEEYYGYDCAEWWPMSFFRATVFDFILKEHLVWLDANGLTLDDVYNVIYGGDPDNIMQSYPDMQDLLDYREIYLMFKPMPFDLDGDNELSTIDFHVSAANLTGSLYFEDTTMALGAGINGDGSHGSICRLTLSDGTHTYNRTFCARFGYPISSGMSFNEVEAADLGIDTAQRQIIYKIVKWYANRVANAPSAGRKNDYYLEAQVAIWLALNNNFPTKAAYDGNTKEAAQYIMHHCPISSYMESPNNLLPDLISLVGSVWNLANATVDEIDVNLHFFSNGLASNQWVLAYDELIKNIDTPTPTEPVTPPATPDVDNPEYYGRIQICKKDSVSDRVIVHDTTEFTIYEWNGSAYVASDTYLMRRDGDYYVSDYLLYTDENEGRFYVKETERPYDAIFSGYIPDHNNYYFVMEVDETLQTVTIKGDTTANANAESYVVEDDGTLTDFALATIENTGNTARPYFYNTASTGRITLSKIDLEANANTTQGDAISLDGASYTLYAAENILYPDGHGVAIAEGTPVDTKTIQNGTLTFDDLYLGCYYIKENVSHTTADGKKMSYVPGYLVDENTYYVNLYYNYDDPATVVTESAQSAEQVVKAKFSFEKESVNEEATNPLAGAGFTVYRIEALSKYTDSWKNADGTYNVQAIRAAYLNRGAGNVVQNGVLVHTDVYDFTGEEDAIPVVYARNTATTATSFSGVTEYYYNQAQADLAAGRLVAIGGNAYRVAELFSDDNGIITSPYLPYGDYLIVETTTPLDHNQTEPFILNFYSGLTHIGTGVTDSIPFGYSITSGYNLMAENVSATEPYAAWYRACESVTVPDHVTSQMLKIYKYDADTKKDVLAPGAEFALYKREMLTLNGVPVTTQSQFNDYKNLIGASKFSENDTILTTTDGTGAEVVYEIRIVDGTYYRFKRIKSVSSDWVEYDTYTTKVTSDGEDCYVTVPKNLPVGEYLLEEIQAPKGYYNDHGYYLLFSVTTDREYTFVGFGNDNAQNFLIEEHYQDDETRATLTIYKRGEVLTDITQTAVTNTNVLDALGVESASTVSFEYSEEYLAGAEYTIYAAADIYTPDYQYERNADGTYVLDADGKRIRTTWFKEGDVVCVVRTGEAGQNTSAYVTYDGTTPRVETTYNASGNVTGTAYYGASSGTYSTYASHPIVCVTVDAEGKVTVELPLGDYMVAETKAPVGFTKSTETYFVSFEWEGQDVQPVHNCHATQECDDVHYDRNRTGESGVYAEEGLVWVNEPMTPALTVNKRSVENGQLLSGLTYGLVTYEPIYDYHGNLLLAADFDAPALIAYGTTDASGNLIFSERLPVGVYIEDGAGSYLVAGVTDEVTLDGSMTNHVLKGFTQSTGYLVKGGVTQRTVTRTYEQLTGVTLAAGETYPATLTYNGYTFTYDGVMYSCDVATNKSFNTGNYALLELYTPYGIYLEDTAYGVSFHAYYTNDGVYKGQFIGDTAVTDMKADMSDLVTITNRTTKVLVNKKDATTAVMLSGATLAVLDNADGMTVDKWVTNGSTHVIHGLRLNDTVPITKNAVGTYTLRELQAPGGYALAEDICFALVKRPVLDADGNPLLDADGNPLYEMYENDVYVWMETYAEVEESAVIAFGETMYYTWQINEYGVLCLNLKEGVASYELPERLYHTQTIDGEEVLVPDVLMPWEDIIYDADSNPITYQVTDVLITDSALTYQEGYFEDYNILPSDSVFVDTKVVQVLTSSGFHKVDNQTLQMYDSLANPKSQPQSPQPTPTPTPTPTPPTRVCISKQMLTGNTELPGAKLVILDAQGNVIESWITSNEPHYTDKLKAGEAYILRELYAPEGYAVSEDIAFMVYDGKLTHVTMKDGYTRVSVSKLSTYADKPVVGASLRLSDENGNIVEEWISNGEPHIFTARLCGGMNYILEELEAPDGYRLAAPISFTVNRYNEITYVSMYDAPNAVTGDGTPIAIYIVVLVVLVICALTITGILIYKKRKKK